MRGDAVERCHNVADLRCRARKALPGPIYHYLDGGADDEWTLRRNTAAFDEYQLLPRCLMDVRNVDTGTTILGKRSALPVMLSPTGMSRLFHHDKELAVYRAASKFGIPYVLSTMATTSLEEVAEAAKGTRLFQLYIFKDRGLTKELLERCKVTGYGGLCLTVDTPLAGNRERDRRTGFSLPPRLTLHSLLSFGTSFRWLVTLFRAPDFRLVNVAHKVESMSRGATSVIEYVNSQFDRTITWEEAAWLVDQWGGPFLIKGLQAPADVKRAQEIGATAVMISNHGGRQLEGTPAPVDCISMIREAVGDTLELIIDGGVRRGTHILKAIALGANAVSVGRPYLYGLAAGGQRGVERVIEILASELARSMALCGCRSIQDIGRSAVTKLC